MSVESQATDTAKRRYDRVAPFYDWMEGFLERYSYGRWRELLWSKAEGKRVLEVGVGTGKNFPYYPADTEIVAVDFSEEMLKRARDKARQQDVNVDLRQMDVEELQFADNTFDSLAASFVFCSVPNPVRGLAEVARVCKPAGKVVLLEHVLSANRVLGWLMNAANPLVVRLVGANINRRTVENVTTGGLVVEQVTDLGAGIFKLIEARKTKLSS